MKSFGEATLIRTKFSPPRTLRMPVRRPKAETELEASAGASLTLVKSPAGFGKTTLLSMWRQSLIERGRAVAWLTLDQDDNDENRFVRYLGSALAATCSDGAVHVQELDRAMSARVLLTSVINLVDQEEAAITLILDDYDVISDQQVHGQLAFLLRHVPHNLNVVVACRSDPPLELGSLRTHGSLKEITIDSLRLLPGETQAILEGAWQRRLDVGESRAIHDATEGWVAGVHIASLVVPNHLSVRRAVAALPRYSHALGEYLLEHVLGRLPEPLMEFVLRCARPTRLCADLCRHLTGDDQAAAKLQILVQSNLFLAPIDEEGEWFRFHGLFADFLRATLTRLRPQEVIELDVKATEWFSAQGLWAEAVRHALDAQRVDLAADWLERCALGELRGSRVREFLGWVNKLPTAILDERPRLRISHVWALILTLQTDEGLALGLQVEARLIAEGGPLVDLLLPILKSQRVSVYSLQDRIEEGMALGAEVWAERFPNQRRPVGGFDWEDEAFLSCLIHFQTQAGNLDEAWWYRDFYEPGGEVEDNPFLRSYRTCVTAALEIRDCRIHAAAIRLEEGLLAGEQLAGRRSFAATLLAAMLASIYCEWNRLDAVEELLANRLDVVDDACYLEPVRAVYLSLARLRLAEGNYAAGHNALSRAESLALRRRWPRLMAACLAMRVELWTRQGQIADAQRSLERLDALADSTISRCHHAEFEHMRVSARACLLLATGAAAEALSLLGEAAGQETQGLTSQHPHDRVHRDLLEVRALAALGDMDAAVASLQRCIGVIEREGLVRRLHEAAPDILDVLSRIRDELPRNGRSVVSEVLAELRVRATGTTPGDVDLSLREQRILTLVADQKSNKQIARELLIAPETVKWHLKNIFRKLHVVDRAQAASVARERLAEISVATRPDTFPVR